MKMLQTAGNAKAYCPPGFHSNTFAQIHETLSLQEKLPILGLNLLPPERKRYEEIRRKRQVRS